MLTKKCKSCGKNFSDCYSNPFGFDYISQIQVAERIFSCPYCDYIWERTYAEWVEDSANEFMSKGFSN